MMMRLAFLLLGIMAVPLGSYAEYSEWDSNFNMIHIVQHGNQTFGSYEYSGGLLVGTLEGRILKGFWSENDDKTICGPKGQWSGPFVLEFSSDGRSFKGRYGKCERGENSFDNLPADRTWSGTLLKGKMSFK
jgi:hypothetical protein